MKLTEVQKQILRVDATGSAHNLNLAQYKIKIADIRLPANDNEVTPDSRGFIQLKKMEMTRILIPLSSILSLQLVTPQLKI